MMVIEAILVVTDICMSGVLADDSDSFDGDEGDFGDEGYVYKWLQTTNAGLFTFLKV